MSKPDTSDPQYRALMIQLGREMRSALDQHDELMTTIRSDYDEAVEHEDEEKILSVTLLLMLFASMSPIGEVLRKYHDITKTMERAKQIEEKTE